MANISIGMESLRVIYWLFRHAGSQWSALGLESGTASRWLKKIKEASGGRVSVSKKSVEKICVTVGCDPGIFLLGGSDCQSLIKDLEHRKTSVAICSQMERILQDIPGDLEPYFDSELNLTQAGKDYYKKSRSDSAIAICDLQTKLRVSSDKVVCRERLNRVLTNHWSDSSVTVIGVSGPVGVGKTCLLREWIGQFQKDNPNVSVFAQGLQSPGLTEGWIETCAECFGERIGEGRGRRSLLLRMCSQVFQQRPCLLVVDSIDGLLSGADEIADSLELLRLLVAQLSGRSKGLLVLCGNDLTELDLPRNRLIHVEGMDAKEVVQLLSFHFPDQPVASAVSKAVRDSFGGNPTSLQLAISGAKSGLKELEEAAALPASLSDPLEGRWKEECFRATEYHGIGKDVVEHVASAISIFPGSFSFDEAVQLLSGSSVLPIDASECCQIIGRIFEQLQGLGFLEKVSGGKYQAPAILGQVFGLNEEKERSYAKKAHGLLQKRTPKEPKQRKDFNSVFSCYWLLCRAGDLNHAVAYYLEKIQGHATSRKLWERFGSYRENLGLLKPFFDGNWKTVRKELVGPVRAILYRDVGWCLRGIGRYQDSVDVFLANYELLEGDVLKGRTAVALAYNYFQLDNLTEAKVWIQDAKEKSAGDVFWSSLAKVLGVHVELGNGNNCPEDLLEIPSDFAVSGDHLTKDPMNYYSAIVGALEASYQLACPLKMTDAKYELTKSVRRWRDELVGSLDETRFNENSIGRGLKHWLESHQVVEERGKGGFMDAVRLCGEALKQMEDAAFPSFVAFVMRWKCKLQKALGKSNSNLTAHQLNAFQEFENETEEYLKGYHLDFHLRAYRAESGRACSARP